MERVTPETLLVSALINSGDASAANQYQITPDKLVGHRDVLNWVMDYQGRWGHVPTEEHLKVAFPGFPLSEEEDDPRWSAAEILESYYNREALKAIMAAGKLLKEGKTGQAVSLMQAVTYSTNFKIPRSIAETDSFLTDYVKPEANRINVTWDTLQRHTNGIGPGELWYLPARPMQGKSHFLVEMATDAYMMGHSVMLVSLEMTRQQCQVRFHATAGHKVGWGDKVDAMAMLRRQYPIEDYRALLERIHQERIGNGVLDIHDLSEGFASPATIARYASDYDLVLIDYVGLMRGDSGSRSIDDWREAAKISNALKEIAMSRNCRIVAATQINREGDNHHAWMPPKLRHLSQTDALAQDGDVVVTLRNFGRMSRIFSIEKNRHGESSRLFFTNFDPNVGNFTEIPRAEADQLRDMYPLEDS
jgi:hypothetical protein